MQQNITECEAREVLKEIIYNVVVTRRFNRVRNLPEHVRIQGKIPYNWPIVIQKVSIDNNKITGYCQPITGNGYFLEEKDRILIEVDKAFFRKDLENKEYDFSGKRVKMVFNTWLSSNSIS